MVDWQGLNPILQGFLGTLFTWFLTALGSAVVFFTFRVNLKVMDFFFGTAAGVMVAASYFGLLSPGIELASNEFWGPRFGWVPCVIGFIVSFVILHVMSVLLHLYQTKILKGRTHKDILLSVFMHGSNEDDEVKVVEAPSVKEDEVKGVEAPSVKESVVVEMNDLKQDELKDTQQDDTKNEDKEGKNQELNTSQSNPKDPLKAESTQDATNQNESLARTWQRTILLIFAITFHNFPEGLAVGVAFGAAKQVAHQADPCREVATFGSAVALALGIGIQNFPEGMAVSLPLRREGMGKFKAFLWGQASGLVEPIGGVIGAAATYAISSLLPYALGFAAGAMIYVVIEEIIPEVHAHKHGKIATYGFLIGFCVMMALDVALG